MPVTLGTVISLQLVRVHGQQPQHVPEVKATVGHGLDGDLHGKTREPGSRRQIVILDRTTLTALGLRPGDLREQITVDFPELERLSVGTLLKIGEVTCELAGPCEPCTHIGGLVGVADPRAFQETLVGRRGQLARIVAVDGDGMIRVGDPVVPAGVAELSLHEPSG